ncbi:TetR/AcrR family transcriptional regulator [Paenibacillus sp. JNUCC31]|uniref:TetR/AcrR family transcriptional regulator n=1 Tax=Paenibacillus sp. JNUCC-31 TaxID=2777983 RepID=UPI00177D5CD9|nr:TetR/AcrR family transcriptional regulator [Paenibacillus sp. JNUCC-31]QOS79377.1 TetR/AcrR family transcriptional regulator [Paenibacillus sp. JNUCC-31]
MRTKSEDKRKAIIDAALQLLKESASYEVSMSEIAARVGGSKATLYNYFSSKQEVFVELVKQSVQPELTTIQSILSENENLKTVLQNFGEHYLHQRCSPDTIAINRMLIAESARSDVGILFFEEGQRKILGMLSVLFEKEINAQNLKNMDTKVVVSHFIALIESELVEKCLFGFIEDPSDEQIKLCVERAVSVFLDSYLSN